MALLVAILAGTVLFTAGARIGHFLLVGVGAAPLAFGAVASAQYRLAPGLSFLNPGRAPPHATGPAAPAPPGPRAGPPLRGRAAPGRAKPRLPAVVLLRVHLA